MSRCAEPVLPHRSHEPRRSHGFFQDLNRGSPLARGRGPAAGLDDRHMCGIVGAVADRDVVPILIEGLRRLEYRGYDSAGIAVAERQRPSRAPAHRRQGRRSSQDALTARPAPRPPRHRPHALGDARRAHRAQRAPARLARRRRVVHNGIIENHEELRAELSAQGYEFTSDTDTEVIAHLDPLTTSHRARPVRGGARRPSPSCTAPTRIAVMCEPGPGPHRGRAHRLPARCIGLGDERELRRLRHRGAAAGDAHVHLSSRRATSPSIRRQSVAHRRRERRDGRAQALRLASSPRRRRRWATTRTSC